MAAFWSASIWTVRETYGLRAVAGCCAVMAAIMLAASCSAADSQGKPVYDDPAATDADFPVQGEYAGEVEVDGQRFSYGVQLVAEGNGSFMAVGYPGGLPGAGADMSRKFTGKGVRVGEGKDAVVKIEGVDADGVAYRGEVRDGAIVVLDGSRELARLPKVERKSPTLGKAAPEGAVVVFDGKSLDGVEGGRMTDGGLLMQGVKSKATFGDATLHIEFRLPYQPQDRGQARGNSGAYIQGCYEVQMLDSFGLEGLDNECGGIYKAARPDVNMCLPPLSWQTYDINFTTPRFEDGKKVANAKMTVRHNGVVIHENLEIPEGTPGGSNGEGQAGPLYLQDHGNPVRYRNIWIVPKS
jgi:hypothetical protein